MQLSFVFNSTLLRYKDIARGT